ncbi:ATP-binding cassette domain-containing protein [Oecophyllibacter saccharovorans]|uniref:ATP-binding cassette domain-containing protein n=2 Tax=Oecophyllibacter saccharovorans TaxID=2558360 RepID=A0A506URB7_9PROT|nr:ATP-binding cassette domain-containing protein [Oecophyllibacter saccharovorans]
MPRQQDPAHKTKTMRGENAYRRRMIKDETRETAAPNRKSTPDRAQIKAWHRAQGRENRLAIGCNILAGLADTLAMLWQGWELALFVAALLNRTAADHLEALLGFLAASVLRIFLGWLQDRSIVHGGQQARRRLRSSLLKRLQQEGPALLRWQHSAMLGTLLGERIEALEGYYTQWRPASASWIVAQGLILAAVIWVAPRAGLVLAGFCLTLPAFQAFFGIATARASRREFLAMARLQTRFLDRMQGLATIVLAGRIESEAQVMEQAMTSLRRRTVKVLRLAFLTSAATDFAMVGALVTIVISESHVLMHHQDLSRTSAALFAVFMVPEAFGPVRRMAAAYQDRARGKAMAEAVIELGPLPPPPPLVEEGAESALLPRPEAWGLSVDFKDVSYRWAEGQPEVLDDVTLHVQPGGILIIEGTSGVGKTTLLELLIGFIQPQSGKILLGGADIALLSPTSLTELIAWIGQKPVLFSGSLEENILFGNPQATPETLAEALQASGVAAFLDQLPAGLQTRVGEGGYGLSGGQAQRVAIARAWLKNAPLLVLDEPTAHLDAEAEAGIVQALEALMRSRTVVLATHSTAFRQLSHAQCISLQHGKVVFLQDGTRSGTDPRKGAQA